MKFLSYSLTLLTIIVALGTSAQTARLQVIHNSPDAAAAEVDIYADDALLLDDFAFRTASPFVDVPSDVEIIIGVAPANSTSSSEAIATFPVTFLDGETYVVVADGVIDIVNYNPAPAFGLQVFDMGREMATDIANTDVLVHHGSTDAPTVDVIESGVGAGTIVDNASYTDFTSYLELPTADYVLDVASEDGSTVVASFSAPLEALSLQGEALTIVASGFLDPSVNNNGAEFGLFVALAAGGPLVALPPVVAAEPARVQIIHNCADAAAEMVDIYANGALLLDNFAFRTATPFVDIPAEVEVVVGVAPSNSTDADDAIATFPLTLASEGTYIVVADGILDVTLYNPAPAFNLEVFDMGREIASMTGNTDVLVHHGSTDAPTVDVVETGVGAGTIVDNASYPAFAGYLELGTADYELAITDETGGTTVATYAAPLSTLSLGDAAIAVIASGFLDPSVNNDGPAFGLYVALASGGDLIALPTVTGLDELEVVSAMTYPNPTADFLTIELEQEMNASVSIMDMNGRLVLNESMNGLKTTIDIRQLAVGQYRTLIVDQNSYATFGFSVSR